EGDLAKHIEDTWIEYIVPKKDLFHRETISRRVSNLRAELLGPCPSAVKRLLVDQIVLCWLHVYDAEVAAADLYTEDFTGEQGTYAQERLARAQRSYFAAVKAMAQVRKLLVPVVQVNIAREQTNVVAAY